MFDDDVDWTEYIDWSSTLRTKCTALSMDPRASEHLSEVATGIYAHAISAKDWNGLSNETYEQWARHMWHVLTFMEEGEGRIWWE